MHKSLIAAALAASMGIVFGRRDSTGVCILSKDGEIIHIKTMDSKIQGQEPDLIIIDDIPPMVSEKMMDQIIETYGHSSIAAGPYQGQMVIRHQDDLFMEALERSFRSEPSRNRFFRALESRPAFTSPKPLTKRQKRRAKGKK